MVSGTKDTRDLGLGFQKKAKVLEDSHQNFVYIHILSLILVSVAIVAQAVGSRSYLTVDLVSGMDTAFFILHSFFIQAASLFIHSGMNTALHSLPDGASVGVLTMKGSFCPITLGHVDVFRRGRDFLLDPKSYGWCHLEKFSHCIGILSLNSSKVVNCKMDGLGENSISFEDRTFLVSMAIEDITWLTLDHGWSSRSWMTWLQCQWPYLSFERFVLNGADDVVKHCKWHWASSGYRMITVGRNLSNDAVVQAMKEYDIEEKDLHFIFLPDI